MTSFSISSKRVLDALSCPARTLRPPPRPTPSPVLRSLRSPLSSRFASSGPPPPPSSPTLASSSGSSGEGNTRGEDMRRAMAAQRARLYAERAKKSRSILLYSSGTIIIALGVTYAAVPLYRAFCSATGFGGVPVTDSARFSPDRLYVTPETADRKRITVHFEATSADTLPWKFEPVTRSVRVLPGETALAFYRAKNVGKEDLIGIATYNMTPEKIAPYFAKVECFCFEEQKIRAGEEVDLPVFFFIDRDIVDDPKMDGLDDVILNYTFFKARRNNMGHMEPDAPEDVVQRSQGFEGYELAKKEPKVGAPSQVPA